MKRLCLSIVASACLLFGIVGLNAQPASATNWCGNLMSYVKKPHYSGANGIWVADIDCGVTSWPHTNMGVGGDINNVRLCIVVLGGCANAVCWNTSGSTYCQAYVAGGQRVRTEATRNGVWYVSPQAST